MTAPTAAALAAASKPGVYLLLKRGLYYRPNNCGYTGIRDHAGEYTLLEASAACGGSVTMIAYDEAPEITGACFQDLALAHFQAKIATLTADRDQWRDAHTREYEARIATEMEQSAAVSARAAAEAALAEARAATDGAYLERNRLVALLASLFPSGIKNTAIEGWDAAWHGCTYVDLPTGQASWHFHESQRHLFKHLPPYAGEWDGHSTDEKYERVARAALEHKS